jgi:hypothetical protein
MSDRNVRPTVKNELNLYYLYNARRTDIPVCQNIFYLIKTENIYVE